MILTTLYCLAAMLGLVFFSAPTLYGSFAPGVGVVLIVACELPLLVACYLVLATALFELTVEKLLYVEILELDHQGYTYSKELRPEWLQRLRGGGQARGARLSEGDLSEVALEGVRPGEEALRGAGDDVEKGSGASGGGVQALDAQAPRGNGGGNAQDGAQHTLTADSSCAAGVAGNGSSGATGDVTPGGAGTDAAREEAAETSGAAATAAAAAAAAAASPVTLGEGLEFGANLSARDALHVRDAVRRHLAAVGASEQAPPAGPGRPPRDPYHEAQVADDGSLLLVCGAGLPSHSRLLTAVGYMSLWTMPVLLIVPFVPRIEGYSDTGVDAVSNIAPLWTAIHLALYTMQVLEYLTQLTIRVSAATVSVTRTLQVFPGFVVPFGLLDGCVPTRELRRPAGDVERIALRLPLSWTDVKEDASGSSSSSRSVVQDGGRPGSAAPATSAPPPAAACLRLQLRRLDWWRARGVDVPHTQARERDWLRWHLASALGLQQRGRGSAEEEEEEDGRGQEEVEMAPLLG